MRIQVSKYPLVFALALLTLTGSAQAALVTYQATGVITYLDNAPRPDSVFPSVALGDAFAVQWSFDDAAAPCSSGGGRARYCAIESMTVIVGSTTRSFAIYREDLGFQDIVFDSSMSGWTWFGGADAGGHFDRVEGSMGLYFGPPESGPLAATGTSIPSPDDLPMPSFNGQGFLHYQHAATTPFFFDETDDFSGTVTFVSAVVPLPASLALLANACGLLVLVSRGRRLSKATA